jgi:hypothetical protein
MSERRPVLKSRHPAMARRGPARPALLDRPM